jgi:O-antigen/teichoic acid export membrane protein
MASRLVTFAENKLGVTANYLLRGGLWLTLYQGLVMLSLIGLSIAFSRLLPRGIYGEYSFVVSAAAVIGSFSLTGFSTAITQSTARGYEGSLYVGVRENLRWSALAVLGALVVAGYFAVQHSFAYAASFCIVAVAVPLFQSAALGNSFLLGKREFKAISLQKGALSLLSAICVFIALLFKANLIELVGTYFASRLIIEIVCYLWTTVRYPPQNLRTEEGFIAHAKSLSGFSILATFADEADSLFLFILLGPMWLAVYSFAVAPPELLKGAIKNYISWLGVPVFANLSPKEARHRILPRMMLAATATCAVVGVYILCAPLFFSTFFPQYLDAVRYSQIFSLSLILVTMANFPIMAIRSMQSTKQAYYRFLLIAECFQIALLFTGVWLFGIWGAIAAYFATRAFRLLYASLLLYRA